MHVPPPTSMYQICSNFAHFLQFTVHWHDWWCDQPTYDKEHMMKQYWRIYGFIHSVHWFYFIASFFWVCFACFIVTNIPI